VRLAELKESRANAKDPASRSDMQGRQDTLEEAERKHVLKVLEDMRWALAGPQRAAARLG